MHIAEVVTIAKSLPLLRLNTYKSLILSYSADYRRIFYEKLRDVYFNIQHLRRPELNVRGMVFAFQTDTAHKVGFRTDIIRGEDGSLALGLKKYGKIKFVRSRKARAVTGYGTISADGSLFNSFWKRTVKGINNFTSLFHYKEKYEDEDSNLIK